MEETNDKTSKYSSGVSILVRLNSLWIKTQEFILNGRYQSWNTTLDIIWLELARDLKEKANTSKHIKSFEEYSKEFNEFDEDIKKIGTFNDTTSNGFEKVSKGEIEKREKHYNLLKKKQLFLARLENIIGKGTTYDDEDDDDM